VSSIRWILVILLCCVGGCYVKVYYGFGLVGVIDFP